MSRLAAGLLLAAGVLVPGYAVLCLSAPARRLPLSLALGLSVALGAAATSYGMLLLALAGRTPSLAAVLGMLALSALVLALAGRARRVRVAPPAPLRGHEALLAALLALPCAWLVADALLVPLHNIDAIAIWAFKAKVLVREPLLASYAFQDPTLSYSHQDYPLLVPFLTATAWALRGSDDEPLAKLAQAALFGALLLLLHAGFRRRLPRAASLVLLLLFLASPAVLAQAAGGLADPALLLYHAGSLVALLVWLERDDPALLAIGAFLTACLPFVKNEGIALAGIQLGVFAMAVVAARRGRSLLALARAAALALPLLAPWLWVRAGLPRSHENYGALLRPGRIAAQLDRVPEILAALGGTMLDLRLWGGLWLLLPVAALLAARRAPRREARVLWAILTCHLLVYVCVFVVTPWELGELLAAKAFPLLLQASPALLLLLAAYWGGLLQAAGDGEPGAS